MKPADIVFVASFYAVIGALVHRIWYRRTWGRWFR